jgi:hypothetical protein
VDDIVTAFIAISALVSLLLYRFFFWSRLMYFTRKHPIESTAWLLFLGALAVVLYGLLGGSFSDLTTNPEPLLAFMFYFVAVGLIVSVVIFSLKSWLDAHRDTSQSFPIFTASMEPERLTRSEIRTEIYNILRNYETHDSRLTSSVQRESLWQATLILLKDYGKRATHPLLEVLTDKSGQFGKAASACAYTALEEIDPVALYIHILNYSKKPEARRKAAKRLGDIADKKALQALKQHLNDDDQAVRKIAADTIDFYSAVGEI